MGCLSERLASHAAAGSRAQSGASTGVRVARRRSCRDARSVQQVFAIQSGSSKGTGGGDGASLRREAGTLSFHNSTSGHKDKASLAKQRGDVLKSFALQTIDYSFYRALEPVTITPEYLWQDRLLPLLSYLTPEDKEQVHEAVYVAFKSHDGQKRKSGEPFITHPVEVTRILAELKMDHESLIAGLLHDTVEDTDAVSFEDIGIWFGPAVRRIVEGETKFSKIGKIGARPESPAASGGVDVKALDLQQLFLSMTEEVRIIVVKLADRLHNMRTLDSMPEHKQRRIAEETLQVFAPLARLLGLYSIKEELEDLAFRFSDPRKYNACRDRFTWLCKEQHKVLLEAQQVLEGALSKDAYLLSRVDKFAVEIHYKALYSVYRRSRDKKTEFRDQTDVAQLRVVLKEKDDPALRSLVGGTSAQLCYHVMGVVHSMWAPVPGSMKDYIATPKTNGYQSLHTNVLPLGSQKLFPLEVQIRTEEMQRLAEYGIAGENWVAAGKVLDFIVGAQGQQLTGVTMDAVNGTPVDGLPTASAGAVNGTKVNGAKVNGTAVNGTAVNGTAVNGAPVNGSAVRGGPLNGTEMPVDGDKIFQSAVRYNTPKLDQQVMMRRVNWLNSIREWQEEFLDSLTAREFVDCVTDDLLGQGVFVFTPSGEVMRLPKGATVVDFAYHVHTDVGNQMIAAKVNNQVVHPSHVLQNAEVVEVVTYNGAVTANAARRHQRWLPFARTRSARYKLTRFLTKHGQLLGEELEAGASEAASQVAGLVGSSSEVALRVVCTDRAGLLADISQIIAEHGHNIKSYSGCKDESGQFVMQYELEGDAARVEAMCNTISGTNAVESWDIGLKQEQQEEA